MPLSFQGTFITENEGRENTRSSRPGISLKTTRFSFSKLIDHCFITKYRLETCKFIWKLKKHWPNPMIQMS